MWNYVNFENYSDREFVQLCKQFTISLYKKRPEQEGFERQGCQRKNSIDTGEASRMERFRPQTVGRGWNCDSGRAIEKGRKRPEYPPCQGQMTVHV